jgi:hypothetical protein
MMYYHSWSIILPVGHGSTRIVTIRHTSLIFLRYVRSISSWFPLFMWTHFVTRSHALSRFLMNGRTWLFFTLNTPVDIQSHVVTISHAFSCHVVVFCVFLVPTHSHALSHIVTCYAEWSTLVIVVEALALQHLVSPVSILSVY